MRLNMRLKMEMQTCLLAKVLFLPFSTFPIFSSFSHHFFNETFAYETPVFLFISQFYQVKVVLITCIYSVHIVDFGRWTIHLLPCLFYDLIRRALFSFFISNDDPLWKFYYSLSHLNKTHFHMSRLPRLLFVKLDSNTLTFVTFLARFN